MMSRADAGGSRNACYALTCLVTSQAGHQHVLKNQHFPQVLDTLCHLLQAEEPDSCWFAAITVKGISKFPLGVVRLRQHPTLELILNTIAASHMTGDELLQEVEVTLRNLQRLPQPDPPTAKILESGSVMVVWKECRPPSGLTVTYSLYDGDQLLYHGLSFSYIIPHCKPGHHRLTVVMETEGDRSPASANTPVTVVEPLPSRPTDFQAVGRTATRVKLTWNLPAVSSADIKYVVYREEILVETTSNQSCIVGGLSPSTSYTFSLCSCNSRGHSPRVSVVVRTMDRGDHAPDRLTVYVIGRGEIFITWEGPKDPIGRFFNYELSMNGKSVYLGTERSYTAWRLTPNTEYTCTVCAITSEGRFESRPVTKRTARDEYSNLNKNQNGGNRHTATSPTTEVTDQSDKTAQTEPARSSLPKSQNVQLVTGRQTNKLKRDNKAPSTRPRRCSDVSWTAESSNSPGTSQSSPTKPSSPSDVAPGQMSQKLQKESRRCLKQTENGQDKKPELSPGRSPAAASPKPSKAIPLRTPDSGAAPDTKNPQNVLGFRLMPIASLCSLEQEYLLNSRAKTESELIRPAPQEGPIQSNLLQESSQVSDKDRCSTHKKVLQPVRDPIIQYRHRGLNINACDFTDALMSGDKKWCTFSEKRRLRGDLITMYKYMRGQDRDLSHDLFIPRTVTVTKGHSLRLEESWFLPPLVVSHSNLPKSLCSPSLTKRILLFSRRKGSLYGALQKDVHGLPGDSGVTFRLPPAPISVPQRVRLHH
ncbi:TMEM141 protein family [Pristimantis euphronides]